jgi:hypothetical protein
LIVDITGNSTDIKAAIAVLISTLPVFRRLNIQAAVYIFYGLFLKWKRFMLMTGMMEKLLCIHWLAVNLNGNARRKMP